MYRGIDEFEALDIYRFPLQGANLAVIVIFTLIFSWLEFTTRQFGVLGELMSGQAWLMTTLFYCACLFLILEFTARGHRSVPLMSGAILYDAGKLLLKAILLVGCLLGVLTLIPAHGWQLLYAVSLLLFLPVAIGSLVIQGSLLRALNLVQWFKILGGMKAHRHLWHCVLLMFELHKLVSGGKHGQAFQQLQSRLEAEQYRYEDEYFNAAIGWNDPAIAVRMGQGAPGSSTTSIVISTRTSPGIHGRGRRYWRPLCSRGTNWTMPPPQRGWWNESRRVIPVWLQPIASRH